MGFANKNDRHATHLSPRELLFNGLHPASVPPTSYGTGSDVAWCGYRYIHVSSPLAVGIRDYINLSMHINDLSETKNEISLGRVSLISEILF